jgi:hypothetical protein
MPHRSRIGVAEVPVHIHSTQQQSAVVNAIRAATNCGFVLGAAHFHWEIAAILGRRVTPGQAGRSPRKGTERASAEPNRPQDRRMRDGGRRRKKPLTSSRRHVLPTLPATAPTAGKHGLSPGTLEGLNRRINYQDQKDRVISVSHDVYRDPGEAIDALIQQLASP